MNGYRYVDSSTKARVESAIAELGYVPHAAARTLASGRSRAIGVVASDPTLHGAPSALYGVQEAAEAEGYFVSVASLKAVDRGALSRAIDSLLAQSCAGIIIIAPEVPDPAMLPLPAGFPVVALGGGQAADIPMVCVDQVTGAYKATQHLLALGHRTVYHIAGPDDWFDARARVLGWRRALDEARVDAPQMRSGDWSAASGYQAALELAGLPDVTAVLVSCDDMALGALRAFHQKGLTVPHDISIVGFDGLKETAYFEPPLTTVQQDFDQLGRVALGLLLEQVETRVASKALVVIEPDLIVRESTAPPSGARH